jgi:hypothetical protein
VKLNDIINNIDEDLSAQYEQNKLTLHRKELIFTLIKSRVEYLKKLNFEN